MEGEPPEGESVVTGQRSSRRPCKIFSRHEMSIAERAPLVAASQPDPTPRTGRDGPCGSAGWGGLATRQAALLAPDGERGSLDAATEPQLAEDVAYVVLDGLFGEVETLANLLVREAVSDEVEDLQLAL